MDAQLKQKWVEALRSGEYPQCQGMLHSKDGGYCCLGVAATVAGYKIDRHRDEVVRPNGSIDESSYGALEDFGLLSSVRGPLIEMNDRGKSFAEIADYIEANISSDAEAA